MALNKKVGRLRLKVKKSAAFVTGSEEVAVDDNANTEWKQSEDDCVIIDDPSTRDETSSEVNVTNEPVDDNLRKLQQLLQRFSQPMTLKDVMALPDLPNIKLLCEEETRFPCEVNSLAEFSPLPRPCSSCLMREMNRRKATIDQRAEEPMELEENTRTLPSTSTVSNKNEIMQDGFHCTPSPNSKQYKPLFKAKTFTPPQLERTSSKISNRHTRKNTNTSHLTTNTKLREATPKASTSHLYGAEIAKPYTESRPAETGTCIHMKRKTDTFSNDTYEALESEYNQFSKHAKTQRRIDVDTENFCIKGNNSSFQRSAHSKVDNSGNHVSSPQRIELHVTKTDDICQCCPLCQREFSSGSCQMEIDGHIAQCLSDAGDDATW